MSIRTINIKRFTAVFLFSLVGLASVDSTTIHEEVEVLTVDTYSKTLSRCVKHIKDYEGLSQGVYIDNDGSRTIGYGHHLLNHENFSHICERIADSLLRVDLGNYLTQIHTKYGLEGEKALAVALFSYNCGLGNFNRSTLKGLILSNENIDNEIVKWKHFTEGGVVHVNQKLLERREFELMVYKGEV